MNYFDQIDKWVLSLTELEMALFIVAFIATILGIILFFVWLFSPKPSGEKYYVTATVEEKTYAPPRKSSGTGIGVTPSGQVGTVATSSSIPQSFSVVFITDTKEVIVVDDKNAYAQLSEGQRVRLLMQPYKLFGMQKESRYVSFEII
jgi:hypothetical protein